MTSDRSFAQVLRRCHAGLLRVDSALTPATTLNRRRRRRTSRSVVRGATHAGVRRVCRGELDRAPGDGGSASAAVGVAHRAGRVREEPGPRVDGIPEYVLRFNPSARQAPHQGEPSARSRGDSPAWRDRAGSGGVPRRQTPLGAADAGARRGADAHHACGTDALPDGSCSPRSASRGRSSTAPPHPGPSGRCAEAPCRARRAWASIVVSGAMSDRAACVRALNRFVDARAREVLPAELARSRRPTSAAARPR